MFDWITISLMLYGLVACGLFVALVVHSSRNGGVDFGMVLVLLIIAIFWPISFLVYLFTRKKSAGVA